jgi:hypothetical protein
MFLRIRMTYFPLDSIDQIDDIGGRLRIHLSTGIKIDLDPIESEKVLLQVHDICANKGNSSAQKPGRPVGAELATKTELAALDRKVNDRLFDIEEMFPAKVAEMARMLAEVRKIIGDEDEIGAIPGKMSALTEKNDA